MLAIIIATFLLAAFVVLYNKYIDHKLEKLKADVDSILSLNISHLHDASNFFDYIKNSTEDAITRSFARGANYHFRKLFDSLQSSKKSFDQSTLDEACNSKLELLYQKERLDLKDLLELELFQVSKLDRVNFIDSSQSNIALINGNFMLLSKTLINLVENALKYTDEAIKVELIDAGSQWRIKVFSYGQAISENFLEAKNSRQGHGLRSLVDIVDYHNGQVKVSSIENEGSVISLSLSKYKEPTRDPALMPAKLKSKLVSLALISTTLLTLVFVTINLYTHLPPRSSLTLPAIKYNLDLSNIESLQQYQELQSKLSSSLVDNRSEFIEVLALKSSSALLDTKPNVAAKILEADSGNSRLKAILLSQIALKQKNSIGYLKYSLGSLDLLIKSQDDRAKLIEQLAKEENILSIKAYLSSSSQKDSDLDTLIRAQDEKLGLDFDF